jgi:hypothetical protein
LLSPLCFSGLFFFEDNSQTTSNSQGWNKED